MDEIRVEHLQKIYQTEQAKRKIFGDLNLNIPTGKLTVLAGRSGCGKTTLLNLLGGLDKPDGGEIILPDDYHSTMLYPEPYLITWTTVLNNISLACGAGLTPLEREKQARGLMELVGLSDCETMTPAQMSSGMKQRLALARALATQSQLLLMDEPFAALDFITRAEMQRQLLHVQQEAPRTIVFVTHQLDEAIVMADQIAVIHADGSAVMLSVDASAHEENYPAFGVMKKAVMAECMK